MKIFNQQQLQSWDQYTVEVDGISSLELIEDAGEMLADEIEILFLRNYFEPIIVYCGMGNNGADGLVLARQLSEFIEDITVVVVKDKDRGSEEFHFYLDVIEEFGVPVTYIEKASDLQLVSGEDTMIIDALLGTGLNRPVTGLMAEVIKHINSLNCYMTIAIDLPSGMYPDLMVNGPAIEADYTLSIAARKMSSFFQEHSHLVGKVTIVPLPLSHDYYTKTETTNYLIELFDMVLSADSEDPHAYKKDFGHVLFVGGSSGKMGAALLASEASLRAGCGLLTAHIPACGVNIMQIGLPEAMVYADEQADHVSQVPGLASYDAICVGCGMGQNVSIDVLTNILNTANIPKVLDADALNIMAKNPDLFKLLNENCVLTPHVGEFHRLFGHCDNSQIRYEKLTSQSKSLGCYIVLKGRYTMIATPEGHCHVNMTGNSTLGTAGSGDVLAGYLAGFLAQGMTMLKACTKAVCLHGFAGDLLRDENGPRGSLARDILNKLARIDKHLEEMIESFIPKEADDDMLGLDLLENPN